MYLASVAKEEVKQSPQTVHEALQGAHGKKWQAAMESEMESLRENGVYEIVDRLSCGITSCMVHTCNSQLRTIIVVYVSIYM